MECGIVGLPGAGKTTLFNALTAGHASIVPGAPKPNVGVAVVPDPRLALVAKYVETRKVTPATITLVDIPGIDAGGGAAKAGPLLPNYRSWEFNQFTCSMQRLGAALNGQMLCF